MQKSRSGLRADMHRSSAEDRMLLRSGNAELRNAKNFGSGGFALED